MQTRFKNTLLGLVALLLLGCVSCEMQFRDQRQFQFIDYEVTAKTSEVCCAPAG